MKRSSTRTAALVVPLSLCFLTACSTATDEPRQVQANQSSEPTPVSVAPASTPLLTQLSPTPPGKSAPASLPNPDEVRSAVSRVFVNVASPEFSRKPAFLVGDFNGDGSEDLAVLVKPNDGQVGEINNELANWILEDPRNVPPRRIDSHPPAKPARAEKDEILLTIIHGAGPGWRSPEAKQTYLLKNEGATTMTLMSRTDLQAAEGKRELPPLRGDAINETVNGKSAIIYWTGAKYAWYREGSK